MSDFTILNPKDTVGIALKRLSKQTTLPINGGLDLADDIPPGHKFALVAIPAGEQIIKYGEAIGHATADIPCGSWVHVHNVKTNLRGVIDYAYAPENIPEPDAGVDSIPTFMGYCRANGKVGIRNEIWIIPTVSCVNRLVERLAAHINTRPPAGVDAAVAFPHPHGCSQLGQDHENTRRILANLALHPNAGAVLFVGLGCENNTVADFRRLVESHPDSNPNIAYMVAQEEGDEFAAGLALLEQITDAMGESVRVPVPVSRLVVGLKCGGSDGLSGITANPLVGRFSDWLVDRGGSTVLSEVPEMFGAETSLFNRAVDSEVFQRGVDMVNQFKRYFERYGQTIYENPSPGNKDGGITTLEDKSLGCTQKSGSRPVADVLPYGGVAAKPGVTLLSGPGNDIVAVSLLAAAGAHMVLFTTGRGTPLGGPVPVVKIATNSDLARRKRHWIDFDAGPLADGEDWGEALQRLVSLVLQTASGKHTCSESQQSRDFAIFKDGVTL
ncbi:MAG: altronate dehydratase family protein [Planctomycetes bacterium]|nr:altronate dehydratase family protein [Planctomycetota bacterium]